MYICVYIPELFLLSLESLAINRANFTHCCPKWKYSIIPPNLHKTTKEKVE